MQSPCKKPKTLPSSLLNCDEDVKKEKKKTSSNSMLSVSICDEYDTYEDTKNLNNTHAGDVPIPLCHNIVSTSQIRFSLREIDLQRLASLFPFTSYDRKRFAAITIRLANPHCTCLLFGSGKLVITGSTSFHACIVASQTVTDMLREVNPRSVGNIIS